MVYVVQLGELEVFVGLLSVGYKHLGIEPHFEVTAGTDWEGLDVYISGDDAEAAIAYVKKHHHDEVYS